MCARDFPCFNFMMGDCCFFPSARGDVGRWGVGGSCSVLGSARGDCSFFYSAKGDFSVLSSTLSLSTQSWRGPRLQVDISKPHRSLVGSAANFSVLCSAMDNLTVLPSAMSLAAYSQKQQWMHEDFLETHRFLSAQLITRFCLQGRRGERRTRKDNGCTLISWRPVDTSPCVHW